MKYCENCCYTTTRPDLSFDCDGVCDACNSAEAKEKIDWEWREKELIHLLKKFKRDKGYDCIVPVSGGKDSTYQVLKLKEYGMHPLLVTFAPCDSTEEGKHNLANMANFGDHILITLNRKVYKELFKIGFKEIGDACWPCHSGIFTAPIKLAAQMGIDLVVYGENPHTEYGGPDSANASMDKDWLKKYGGLCGLFAEDIKGVDKRDLYWFEAPSDEELKEITPLYLGHYLKWDAHKQLDEVEKNGFIRRKVPPANAILDYENVDCGFVDMHDHLMYKKFGFGRATTQLGIQVRNKRLGREAAIITAKKFDKRKPDFKKFSKFTGLSIKEIKDNIKKYTK